MKYHFNVISNRSHRRRDPVSEFVEFVVDSLEAEKHNKDGGHIQGYFADRDSVPGSNVFDENIRVVKNSDYTIVVLDRGFIKKAWSMYLKNMSFKLLIDTTPNNHGTRRFIPIAFGLEPEEIEKLHPAINCQEVIYFETGYYKDDERNMRRLIKVIRDGKPMDDPEILASVGQPKGLANIPRHTPDQGNMAVGSLEGNFSIEDPEIAAKLDLEKMLSYESISFNGEADDYPATLPSFQYDSSLQKGFVRTTSKPEMNYRLGSLDSGEMTFNMYSQGGPPEKPNESLDRQFSLHHHYLQDGKSLPSGGKRQTRVQNGAPRGEMTSLQTMVSDEEARFGRGNAKRPDDLQERLVSPAKMAPRAREETGKVGEEHSDRPMARVRPQPIQHEEEAATQGEDGRGSNGSDDGDEDDACVRYTSSQAVETADATDEQLEIPENTQDSSPQAEVLQVTVPNQSIDASLNPGTDLQSPDACQSQPTLANQTNPDVTSVFPREQSNQIDGAQVAEAPIDPVTQTVVTSQEFTGQQAEARAIPSLPSTPVVPQSGLNRNTLALNTSVDISMRPRNQRQTSYSDTIELKFRYSENPNNQRHVMAAPPATEDPDLTLPTHEYNSSSDDPRLPGSSVRPESNGSSRCNLDTEDTAKKENGGTVDALALPSGCGAAAAIQELREPQLKNGIDTKLKHVGSSHSLIERSTGDGHSLPGSVCQSLPTNPDEAQIRRQPEENQGNGVVQTVYSAISWTVSMVSDAYHNYL